MRRIVTMALWLVSAWVSHAHIGSPYVLFDGRAGSFPIRVSIREPDVVPGLAEITVRVLEGSADRVLVLPLDHHADRAKAPRPDQAMATPGDPRLYSASLWFMRRGAYAVEVTVEGKGGGRVLVPVDSLARRQEPMGPILSVILVILGVLLVGGYISILASAMGQSRMGPQATLQANLSWRAVMGALVGTVIMGFLLWGGANWWNAEEKEHQQRVLFRPLSNTVSLEATHSTRKLVFSLTDKRAQDDWARLIPDHGKLIHLFLTAENSISGHSSAFAHLHPSPTTNGQYTAAFPPMAAGVYRVYADLAHENGLTETVTNRLEVTAPLVGDWNPSDPDDSHEPERTLESKTGVGNGLTIQLVKSTVVPGVPVELKALVRDSQDMPVPLQPFLRMLGHAVIERSDGAVFAHVHPAGTLSMAVAHQLAVAAEGEAGGRASDVNCGDLSAVPMEVAEDLSRGGEVSFPYVFPESGEYRIWIQVRVAGKIRTGAFQWSISDGKSLARH